MSLKMQQEIIDLQNQVKALQSEVTAMRQPLEVQVTKALERDFTKALRQSLKEIFGRG
jgi:predicted  nucleic acid-binding Zn-ribbon protein